MVSHIRSGKRLTIEVVAAVGNLGQCVNTRSSNILETMKA